MKHVQVRSTTYYSLNYSYVLVFPGDFITNKVYLDIDMRILTRF